MGRDHAIDGRAVTSLSHAPGGALWRWERPASAFWRRRLRAGSLQPWQGNTNLFRRPPFTFRTVDALLTNFHLPKSTLLVLVRTFGGDDLMKRAYEEAIAERYRFFSYGDAMLIL